MVVEGLAILTRQLNKKKTWTKTILIYRYSNKSLSDELIYYTLIDYHPMTNSRGGKCEIG
jgi:hypothetical protein